MSSNKENRRFAPEAQVSNKRLRQYLDDSEGELKIKPSNTLNLETKQQDNQNTILNKQYNKNNKLQTETEADSEERELRNLAPTFLVKPHFIEEDDGNRVVFICRLHAFPQPDVFWYKDDVKLSQDARTNIKLHELDKFVYASQLCLDDVVESDKGAYKLKAVNMYGEVSSSIKFDFVRK